jgi:hypothetical protein
MKKKNGQMHICVHFRDLNKACQKDDFPSQYLKASLTLLWGMKHFLSWMGFLAITK